MSDTEKKDKVLFGRFEIRPNPDVDERDIAKAIERALTEFGDLKRLYVGDDNPPPQPPPSHTPPH